MSESLATEPQPTASTLVRFIDQAIKRGDLKAPTGNAMKTAVKEVLATTEGADWEQVDLPSLDIEDVSRRFETLRAMDYSPGSLATYKARFSKSVKMFQEFRANPSGWRPDVKQRTRTAKAANGAPTTPVDSDAEPVNATAAQGRVPLVKYPYPIRQGVFASVELPVDLTKREAKRLCAFIDSIAEDEQGQLPPGRPELSQTASS